MGYDINHLGFIIYIYGLMGVNGTHTHTIGVIGINGLMGVNDG
jgi:hypothetical protein